MYHIIETINKIFYYLKKKNRFLSDNILSGTIPESMRKLTNLKYL